MMKLERTTNLDGILDPDKEIWRNLNTDYILDNYICVKCLGCCDGIVVM